LRKAVAVLIGAAIAMTSLTACSETPSMNNTYQSGDGTVTEFKPASRGVSVSWAGMANDGSALSSANLDGVVTVLNFWYASCSACRIETPDLVALSKEYAGKVQFVGVNVRDSADTANAFKRSFGVDFPSIMDASTGDVVLAFTGVVTPSAVPTTLVIDRQGRVAARILGVADKPTLKALIKTVYEEGSSN
jgi:thiol-disulfide isomerase/thioredoxin